MEFNRCSRCGNFYMSNGNVCPKCSLKDNFELSTFKNYIEENGLNTSLNNISGQTGISVKNLNRFLGYDEINNKFNVSDYNELNLNPQNGNNGIVFN